MLSKYHYQNILKNCLRHAKPVLKRVEISLIIYIGNTNEGISYMPDIYEFCPTDIPILERLATLFSTYHFWKETSYLYEKLYSLSKSLTHLQKRILADYENVFIFLGK